MKAAGSRRVGALPGERPRAATQAREMQPKGAGKPQLLSLEDGSSVGASCKSGAALLEVRPVRRSRHGHPKDKGPRPRGRDFNSRRCRKSLYRTSGNQLESPRESCLAVLRMQMQIARDVRGVKMPVNMTAAARAPWLQPRQISSVHTGSASQRRPQGWL